MKEAPTILGNGLEIHFIQELHGSRREIFDIYELRKNFGRGHLKTLKRVNVPHGSDLKVVESRIMATKEEDAYDTMIRELLPSVLSENQISFQGDALVQLAINEMGLDEVRNISRPAYLAMCDLRNYWEHGNFHRFYEDWVGTKLSECKEPFFNELRARLGDIYVSDVSKTHLREYVDHKFGAELGL